MRGDDRGQVGLALGSEERGTVGSYERRRGEPLDQLAIRALGPFR